MSQVVTLKSSVRKYCREKGKKPVNIKSRNRRKHRDIHFEDEKIRLMWKSAPFNQFGSRFEERLPSEFDRDDVGESIRIEDLLKIQEEGFDKIAVVYRDKSMYEISVDEWDEFRMRYGTIRIAEESGEKTACIPRDLMQRL